VSQMWLERLREAPSKVARDEILLRDWREFNTTFHEIRKEDLRGDVEDQLRALADLAFPNKT
jgi:hypothetical protein